MVFSKKIKICSLFSGIGGFETGIFDALGRDNVEMVFSSEIDKYANQSYEIIYGDKPHGDITKVHESEIPDHDVLVGGFPCQAFSNAGRRLGFSDTRGTLFFEIARIAKEKQPKVMLLENVKGLLNHDKGKTFDVIARTLSELDYKIDFQILNSKFFDVPQNRERVFIVAVRDVKNEEWNFKNLKGSVFRTKKRLIELGGIETFNFEFPKQENGKIRLCDILEKEVDDSLYLNREKEKKILNKVKGRECEDKVFRIDDKRGGNSIHSWELSVKGEVTKKEEEALNRMILERRKGKKDGNPILPKQVDATKEMFDRLVGCGYLKKVNEKYDFNFGNLSFDVSKVIPFNGISPTITCTDAKKYGVLVREEVNLEFVAGVSDKPNWLDNGKELSRNYKQGSRIYSSIGLASTLSAQGVGGLGGYTGLYLVPEWRIRKLSPKECFKIQGFPTDYVDKLQQHGISNSQLYKMAGNAVTTTVIKSLTENIKKYII